MSNPVKAIPQFISYVPFSKTRRSTTNNTNKTHANNLSIDYKKYHHPVVIFHDGIGDAWLFLPAIRFLAKQFPNKLTIICSYYPSPWWLYDLPIKSIILIESIKSNDGFQFNVEEVVKQIIKCDLFISLAYWYNEPINRLLTHLKEPKTIGWHTHFDYSRSYSQHKNMATQAFNLVRLNSDAAFSHYTYPPPLPFMTKNSMDELIKSIRSTFKNSMLLTVHTDTLPRKMWPKENWGHVFNTLLTRYPHLVILIMGVTTDIDYCHNQIINLTRMPFDMSCSIISNADYFLGVDSVLLHVADMFRIPCIGLFNSPYSQQFGCLYAPHTHLEGSGSMLDITPESVVSAFQTIINQTPT